MKTKEELDKLKKEVEGLDKKLEELTDEQLSSVSGGVDFPQNISFVVDQ